MLYRERHIPADAGACRQPRAHVVTAGPNEPGMIKYTYLWCTGSAVLAALGVLLALVSVPPGSLVAAVVTMAVLGCGIHSVVAHSFGIGADHSYVDVAAAAGAGAVVLVGFGAGMGAAGTGIVVLVLAGAPISLRWYGTLLGHPTTTVWDAAPAPADGPVGPAGPVRTRARAVPDSPALPDNLPFGGSRASADSPVRALTDAELCQAWRSSFMTVQRARDASELAALALARCAYLDELQRRDPVGFERWILNGARAGSNPARYVKIRPAPGPSTD
jgi:hypothetical protein